MEKLKAKPFLKWAGGKNQLLDEINKRIPKEFREGNINNYIEPFVGGGALFFNIIQKYNLKEYYIFDMNKDLILTYNVIKNNVSELIEILNNFKSEFSILDINNRQIFYYEIREQFNNNKIKINFSEYNYDWIERAAQMIFLNKTCFNGLFRVNVDDKFNVPSGNIKKTNILDRFNLEKSSILLNKSHIYYGDFSECEHFVDNHTFVYFDPPYRPLNKKDNNNGCGYTKDKFDDKEQIRLAKFYRLLDSKGAKLMLSNSDPKNTNIEDNFFDELYSGYNIERIKARRSINHDGSKRGKINELIITNYEIKSNISLFDF